MEEKFQLFEDWFSLVTDKMGNLDAAVLGQLAREVSNLNNSIAGDSIDRGLILRRRFEEEGYFIFKKI